mmetsp:Transcript_1209/g.1768  ORF Transcript_1209/g.1768 Transcript_1209/m.1768 type:complete len:776 (+) Transcript_1209:217-2544(+)
MSRTLGGTTEVIASVLNDVAERKQSFYEDMNDEFDQSKTWLADVIEQCKRKILEPAGLERQPKKAKTRDVEDKENNDPNIAEVNENVTENVTESVKKESHPDDDIDVKSLKVVELRQELRKRDLDTNGLKKDLQKRLTTALDDARAEREMKNKSATNPETHTEDITVHDATTIPAKSSLAQDANSSKQGTMDESEVVTDGKMDPQSKVGDDMDVEVIEGDEVEDSAAVVSSDDQSDSISANDIVESAPDSKMRSTETNTSSIAKTTASTVPLSKRVSMEMSINDASMEDDSSPEDHSSETTEGDSLEKTTVSAVPLSKRVSMEMSLPTNTASNNPTIQNCLSNENDTASMTSASDGECTDDISSKKSGLGKKLIKATSKLFSPSKKKSPMKNMKSPALTQSVRNQNVDILMTVIDEGQSTQSDDQDSVSLPQDACEQSGKLNRKENMELLKSTAVAASTEQLRSNQPIEISSTPSAIKRAEEKKKIQMALKSSGHPKVTTPSLTATVGSNLSSTGGKSSAQAKKMALSKARLDEIRGMSKPVALSQSTKDKWACADTSASKKASSKLKNTSTLTNTALAKNQASSVKTAAMKTVDDKDAMRAKLNAQMREKARMNSATVPSLNKNRPQPVSSQQSRSMSSSAQKYMQAMSQGERQIEQKEVKPMSPMDTYEISDREDSESDESDYSDDDKPKKRIPKWAQRVHLITALEKQFAVGNQRIDPDNIFPEVQTCNLEEIFDQKKSRYKKRTSSGNWTQDKVTAKEKLVYKREMGFQGR